MLLALGLSVDHFGWGWNCLFFPPIRLLGCTYRAVKERSLPLPVRALPLVLQHPCVLAGNAMGDCGRLGTPEAGPYTPSTSLLLTITRVQAWT